MPRKPTVVAPSSAVVIGGAGFIGSHLVDRLLVDDVTVDVVDDFTTGSLANLAEARARGGRLSIQQLDAAAPELSTLLERRAPEVLYLVRGLGSDARHPLLSVEALAVLVAGLAMAPPAPAAGPEGTQRGPAATTAAASSPTPKGSEGGSPSP